MTAQEVRRKYLQFFKDRGHVIIPRANLVPTEDATTLFTGSGMQPLVPYLLGEPNPNGTRLTDSQTCLRAEDIEEVGDNRHTTFFEMLGNWSLGDYFKAEQLPWFFEFLVDEVGLDPSKLYVTCFTGAPELDIPKDTEAADIWVKLFDEKGLSNGLADIGSEEDGYKRGMNDGERIFFYDGSKNWWSRGGAPASTPVGDPCGPDSEVFYDFGTEHDPAWGEHCHPNCDCGRFLEIGNSVFMAYKRTDAGFEKLEKPNVDFGGGLERIAAAKIDDPDMFKISFLWTIIEQLQTASGKTYEGNEEAMRVIADHLRAAAWLAVDGVVPSNNEQGYVMRRLMRRAIRFALDLEVEHDLVKLAVPTILDEYADDFPEVKERRDEVLSVMEKEEKIFRQTLRQGVKEFDRLVQGSLGENLIGQETLGGSTNVLNGAIIFKLYDTYGFPRELSVEEAKKREIEVSPKWEEEFEAKMEEQRERSRTATKGQFKGGLGGTSEMHKKYHTATHLMYQSLRTVLGDHVIQHGSNITEERLRFDFSHPEKVSAEDLQKVEDMVNEQIKADLPVSWKEYPLKEAQAKGVLGHFGERYGEIVKVYTMGNEGEKPFSFEICGGPHVDHTGQLAEGGKTFKIKKEQASSAGIRRIKAVLV
jgi:alanyl-tRNA synthetase